MHGIEEMQKGQRWSCRNDRGEAHDSPLFAVHQSKENLMTTPKKFLRLPAVIEATGWSRATIWRKVKAGVLPAPIPIGPKSVAWDAEEIAQWQQRCMDARHGVA